MKWPQDKLLCEVCLMGMTKQAVPFVTRCGMPALGLLCEGCSRKAPMLIGPGHNLNMRDLGVTMEMDWQEGVDAVLANL